MDTLLQVIYKTLQSKFSTPTNSKPNIFYRTRDIAASLYMQHRAQVEKRHRQKQMTI